MKKLSKILSLVLALAMVIMSVNIVAVNANDDTHVSIVINDATKGREYYAYRIFSGDPDTDDELGEYGKIEKTAHILKNINWDSDISSKDLTSTFINYLKNGPQNEGLKPGFSYPDYAEKATPKIQALSGSSSISDVLAALEELTDNSRGAEAVATAIADFFHDYSKNLGGSPQDKDIQPKNTEAPEQIGSKYTISDLSEGYYIVIDKKSINAQDIVPVAVMLEVTGSTSNEITAKASQTTVDKTVVGDTDVSSYGVGDKVTFQVDIDIPEDVALYSYYNISFVDTLTNMSYVNGSMKVVDIDTEGTTTEVTYADHFVEVETSEYDSSGNGQQTVTVKHKNFFKNTSEDPALGVDSIDTKHWDSHAGHTLRFTYEATVTTKAISKDSNNTVVLTYANDPNTDSTGATDTSKVDVYTHNLKIVKYDKSSGSEVALNGAAFKIKRLEKSLEGKYVPKDLNIGIDANPANGEVNLGSNEFTWKGLGDGIYEITETPVKDYNNLDGKDNTIYLKIETTKDENPSNIKITGQLYSSCDLSNANLTEPFGSEDGTVTLTRAANGTDADTEELTFKIYNFKGTSLPETGGMGTKIFYALGGLLVVCAVVLLVVKRRMRAE